MKSTPVKRRLILEHWSSEKNLPVSEEVLKRVAIAEPKREKFQKEQERQKAEEEGRIWTIEGRTIRPAKEGEPRMTRADTGVN